MHTANTVVGLFMGVILWLLSPLFTGIKEPWNGNLWVYIPMLLLAGAISAFPNPKNWWQGIFGILLGLWIYFLVVIGYDNLALEEMWKGTLFTLISVGGGITAFLIWGILKRNRPPEEKPPLPPVSRAGRYDDFLPKR
ncbi:MAG: hypothetical protein LBN38_06405 [Verrucomicrobiota bacterium]|jgi:hypothetical protein|nr:hypothetical protein [Verrucomicrobiota bacterium]